MTATPATALQAAIDAHTAIANASRAASEQIAAEREAERAKLAAQAELTKPPAST